MDLVFFRMEVLGDSSGTRKRSDMSSTHPTQIHLESKKRKWQVGSFNITFPFQLVAISDELQGVRFIRRIDVVHVNVQVVRRVQEVVRQQRAFAVVQRKVHLGRDERSAFAARRGNAAIAPRWAQVQGVGWSCSKGIAKHTVLEWRGGGGVGDILSCTLPRCYLQALSSVRPQEGSMSPYSGSSLKANNEYWLRKTKPNLILNFCVFFNGVME